MKLAPADHFEKRIHYRPGCWPWQGPINNMGYGIFWTRVNGTKKRILAHRYSYELYGEPIPEGLQIDHLCRNPICVNPNHLEAVTARENLLRRPARELCYKRLHPLEGVTKDKQGNPARYCKQCHAEYGKKWAAANREKMREYRRKYSEKRRRHGG